MLSVLLQKQCTVLISRTVRNISKFVLWQDIKLYTQLPLNYQSAVESEHEMLLIQKPTGVSPVLNLLSPNLEAFVGTEFNDIFSSRQPRQDLKVLWCFGALTSSPSPGCAGGCLVEPKLMTWCPTLCCVYLRSYGVVRNVIPVVGGRSKKVVALGQGCLLSVVESVSIN